MVLEGILLPLVTKPKILGVTIGPLITLGPYAEEVAGSVRRKLDAVRTIRTSLDYASPVWEPDLAKTHIEKTLHCA